MKIRKWNYGGGLCEARRENPHRYFNCYHDVFAYLANEFPYEFYHSFIVQDVDYTRIITGMKEIISSGAIIYCNSVRPCLCQELDVGICRGHIDIAGLMLFVLNAIWGLLVLVLCIIPLKKHSSNSGSADDRDA